LVHENQLLEAARQHPEIVREPFEEPEVYKILDALGIRVTVLKLHAPRGGVWSRNRADILQVLRAETSNAGDLPAVSYQDEANEEVNRSPDFEAIWLRPQKYALRIIDRRSPVTQTSSV